MKLNFGLRGLPVFRKRVTGRVRSIKIRSYLIILLVGLVPLSILFTFSFSQISSMVVGSTETLAETLRDARAERIRLSVMSTFGNVQTAAMKTLATGTITGFNAADTVKKLTDLLVQERDIERVTLYDSFFEPLSSVDRDGVVAESSIHEQIRVKLMDIRFETGSAMFEMELGNNNPRMILFAQLAEGSRVRGYVTAVYDYDGLDPLIPAPAGVITIYNNRYQTIADSYGLARFEKVINPLTERMLDGYSETIRLDDEIHSYGYIDFTTTELYIDVSIPLDVGPDRVRKLVVTFVFLFVFTAIAATVVAWGYVRSIITYGETILARSRFSKDMRLFRRLASTIESIQGGLGAYLDMQTHVSDLKRDVTTLLSELPRQESDNDT